MEGYATNYRDLIDFQPGAVPKLVNLSTVHVRGLESESTGLRLGRLHPDAAPFLYRRPQQPDRARSLRDVPHWLAGAHRCLWKPDARLAMPASTSAMSAPSPTIPCPPATSPWAAMCAPTWRCSYALPPDLTLQLGVDNLFDAHYDDVVGFPRARRSGARRDQRVALI